MITTILEFRSFLLNEVRIPKGLFRVDSGFYLPDKEGWDVVFSKDDLLEIEPSERKINKWNPTTGQWTLKTVDWNKFMQPDFYDRFKKNVTRLNAEDVSKTVPGLDKFLTKDIEFTSSVKSLPNKIKELGLEDKDKVRVRVLD